MRCFSTLALLATTSFAAVIPRDANSDAVASLDSASQNISTTLTQANTQLQSLSTSGDPPPNGSGIVAGIVNTLEQNLVEAADLFENLSKSGSSTSAASLATQMQTELTTLKTDMSSAQTQLSNAQASGQIPSPISVNGINNLLGAFIPAISDYFNEVADILEALDLPPL